LGKAQHIGKSFLKRDNLGNVETTRQIVDRYRQNTGYVAASDALLLDACLDNLEKGAQKRIPGCKIGIHIIPVRLNQLIREVVVFINNYVELGKIVGFDVF